MIVGQNGGFGVELVEVRGLDHRISMAGKIAVPLVVRDYDDDVGAIGGPGELKSEKETGEEFHDWLEGRR
jgi:hypothetical protein